MDYSMIAKHKLISFYEFNLNNLEQGFHSVFIGPVELFSFL